MDKRNCANVIVISKQVRGHVTFGYCHLVMSFLFMFIATLIIFAVYPLRL